MTTLERLQAHRAEYVKQEENVLAQLYLVRGAMQATDREIADEQKPAEEPPA